MTNAWVDGVVATVFTVVWLGYVLVLSSVRADKLQLYMRCRVTCIFAAMVANLLMGTVYILVSLIQGYPNRFDAQATFASMVAYIVSLALDFPPFFKMYRNSGELEKLLSRRKFKPGDNKHIATREQDVQIVLEVVKSKPRNAGNSVGNYGGEIYVVGDKSYVHSPLGETYLLGVTPGNIHKLFSGHNSLEDLIMMRSIELAILPTSMLRLCNSECCIDICRFLMIAVTSNRGCRASLGNWKSVALGIPSWVENAVSKLNDDITIRCNYVGIPPAEPNDNHGESDITYLISACKKLHTYGRNFEHNVSLAVRLMALLHSEEKLFAKVAIDMINNYYMNCFNIPAEPVEAQILWRNVTLTMFCIRCSCDPFVP